MNGILNVLKPSDMSSQHVISAIKHIMKIKKAGHGGTLDPAAAGVLPVFLGSATRLAEYATEGEKEYIAQIQFGIKTDTQDAQGQIVAQNDCIIGYNEMKNLIDELPAVLWQRPPAYSAIKIGGEKMVDLARRGIEREIPCRQVRLYEKELLCEVAVNAYLLRIRCSKGTYIRTICHDLGMQAGVGAHCSFLLRTRSGPFLLENAVTLEQIEQAVQAKEISNLVLPMDIAVSHLPRVTLDDESARRIYLGQTLSRAEPQDTLAAGQNCALWHRGKLVGIGICDDGVIRPKKVLTGSERFEHLIG